MHRILLTVGILALNMIACDEPNETSLIELGDQTIQVFESTPLRFDMTYKENEVPDEEGVLHFDAGRVALKKIEIPKYDKHVDIKVILRVVSNGDPWDKAGSLFILPGDEVPSLQAGQDGIIKVDTGEFPAITDENDYSPPIEIMRFMTPFGVGYYSDTNLMYPPIYVPEWAPFVEWEADISHLIDELEGDIWVGCYIDTWTGEGYLVDCSIEMVESTIDGHAKEGKAIVSLCNTIKYMPMQSAFDGFSRSDLHVDFEIGDEDKAWDLYYIATGHGGHAEGDEFHPKENIISLDGAEVHRFTPWRNDCASFRRFNPHSGVWRVPGKNRKGEPEEQSLASSDLSRSGWCPGSWVEPVVIPLGVLSKGDHQLSISIPDAQAWNNETSEFNHWLVSAYLVEKK